MRRFRLVLAASATVVCASLAAPAWADVAKVDIRGDLPADLRALIERAVGESKEAPGSRLEARRRAREAAEDAIAALRSEGYYAYEVFPDIGEGDKPMPIVTVTPGPRFTLADPKITWIGSPPPPEIVAAGIKAIALEEGAPGQAADVLAAEGRVVAEIRQRGYADIVIEPRQVVVDHADKTVRPEFRIATGDLVLLNGIDLRTEGRTSERWVQGLSPWNEGDVYDPDDVAELERRLLDAGVYDSVTVSLAPKENAVDGLRPVLVSLTDRPRGTIELGAGFSTSEGVGLDGRWLRSNRLGRADTLTLTLRLAEILSRLDAEISFPHWRRPQRTLRVGTGIGFDNTDAYDEIGANVRADLTRRYGKTSYVTLGAALAATRTEEYLPEERTRDLVTLGMLAALALDRSDDPLDPTRGWKTDIRLEPTASFGDDSVLYLKAQAQGSAYYAFGERARTIAAVRLRLGTVTGGSLSDIPAARRLYAGGGGSVRGYPYQGVGPRLADDTPQGGLSLVESSVEVRHGFTERWGGVVFVDVGAVGDDPAPNFSDISTGVGVGLRYDLGFGPIRADLAIPLNRREGDPSYQIYLSIGQSF